MACNPRSSASEKSEAFGLQLVGGGEHLGEQVTGFARQVNPPLAAIGSIGPALDVAALLEPVDRLAERDAGDVQAFGERGLGLPILPREIGDDPPGRTREADIAHPLIERRSQQSRDLSQGEGRIEARIRPLASRIGHSGSLNIDWF